MQKYIDEKCLYCSSFFCFLTLHAGTWWHSQVPRLFNYVSFSKLHFKLVVCSECQKQLKESEIEPFVIKTKAASVAVLQLSFRKTILNLHLRVQTTSKQLTILIFATTIFRPTCMFTDKEDSGRGITTRKFTRGMKQLRIPQNAKRSTTCLHGVRAFGMTS